MLTGVQSLMGFMRAALVQSDLLNYRPSVVAASVLYIDRMTRAELPFWPSSLAHLTGYSLTHTPELAAAIGTMQRCACIASMPFASSMNPAPLPGFASPCS